MNEEARMTEQQPPAAADWADREAERLFPCTYACNNLELGVRHDYECEWRARERVAAALREAYEKGWIEGHD